MRIKENFRFRFFLPPPQSSRSPAVKIPQSWKTMLEDKAYGHVVTFNAQGKAAGGFVLTDFPITEET
jgi:hypothetical protein